MNLAKMAYNKLKAVEEDKKCLHCGKSAKEGCECPNEAPEGYEGEMEEEDMDEEEQNGIGREMGVGEEKEKEQEITININVGRK